MNVATIFKVLTTVTFSAALLIIGGCNNMETKKEETGKTTAIENILSRKSVRAYTPRPVEKGKVDLLDEVLNISHFHFVGHGLKLAVLAGTETVQPL